MNAFASTTVPSALNIKEDDSFVVLSSMMKEVSLANGVNLECCSVANSKVLLNASFSSEPSNKVSNHINCCSCLISLVRNMIFCMCDDVSIKKDKVVVGLLLYHNYLKLKSINSVKDTYHHFKHLTSYDRSTSVVNPEIWIFWMVCKDTLSLMHVNTIKHTTTLHVPQFKDANAVVVNETLEDVNELIKCSLEDNYYGK